MAGWEWEMEGGKGLLWMAIRKVLCEQKVFVCKKIGVLGQQAKFFANERFLICKKAAFEGSL